MDHPRSRHAVRKGALAVGLATTVFACGGSTAGGGTDSGAAADSAICDEACQQRVCQQEEDSGNSCLACLARNCCSAESACAANSDASAYSQCVVDCSFVDASSSYNGCLSSCMTAHPAGYSACEPYLSCFMQSCAGKGC